MYMFCLHITRFPALLWICRWRPRASVYFFFTRTAILVLQCFELDNKSVYLTTYPCLFDCSAIEITYLILPGSTMSKAPNELIELKDRMKLCTQLVSTAMVCPIWCRFSRGVPVILSSPAFLGDLVRPLNPFSLFCHSVLEGQEGLVHQEGQVDWGSLVDLEV